jgi:hypothetical protein
VTTYDPGFFDLTFYLTPARRVDEFVWRGPVGPYLNLAGADVLVLEPVFYEAVFRWAVLRLA